MNKQQRQSAPVQPVHTSRENELFFGKNGAKKNCEVNGTKGPRQQAKRNYSQMVKWKRKTKMNLCEKWPNEWSQLKLYLEYVCTGFLMRFSFQCTHFHAAKLKLKSWYKCKSLNCIANWEYPKTKTKRQRDGRIGWSNNHHKNGQKSNWNKQWFVQFLFHSSQRMCKLYTARINSIRFQWKMKNAMNKPKAKRE